MISIVEAACLKLGIDVKPDRLSLRSVDTGEIISKTLTISSGNNGGPFEDNAKFSILISGHETGTIAFNPDMGIDKGVWELMTTKAQVYAEASGTMRTILSKTSPLADLETCMTKFNNANISVLREDKGH